MKPISRRDLLGRTSLLATAGATGLPLVATASDPSSSPGAQAPPGKLKIIVTGGHPGDPEYGCGGTIAQYIHHVQSPDFNLP